MTVRFEDRETGYGWKNRKGFIPMPNRDDHEVSLRLSKDHKMVSVTTMLPSGHSVVHVELDDLLLVLSELAKDDV